MRRSRLSLGFLAPLAFALACDGNAPPDVELLPGDEPGEVAFFLRIGDDVAPVLDARVDGSPSLVEAMRGSACESVVSAGEPRGVRLVTDAGTDRRLYRWLAAQMTDASADPLESMTLLVTEGDEVACAIELAGPSLETGRLVSRAPPSALTSAEDMPVALAWSIEIDDGTATEPGDVELQVEEPGETQAALLLPAVQAATAAAPESDDGYPLYDRSGALPPPFVLAIDDEALDKLFPAGDTAALMPVYLKIEDIDVESAAEGALAFDLGVLSLSLADGQVLATPTETPRLVIAGSEPPSELDAWLASLLSQMPDTFEGADFDRAIRLLDTQPDPTGDADVDQAALHTYWMGGSALPNAQLFNEALGAALTLAATEEGGWAYAVTPLASRVFDGLDTAEGRRLDGVSAETVVQARMWAFASFINLGSAGVPMSATVLGSVDEFEPETHSCAAAVAAMQALADLAGPMRVAPPHQLVGIEPDEIDVAIAVRDAMSVTAFDVDRRAVRFKRATEPLLEGEDEVDLDEVYASSAALLEGMRELKEASLARFDMRQP